MISDSKKFIFIHIPKTGGTSINSALKSFCEYPPEFSPGVHNIDIPVNYRKHTKISEMTNIDFDQYFKFCTLRNPWDRILSLYFHRIQRVINCIDKNEKDFNSWMKNIFFRRDYSEIYWFNQLDYISVDGKNKMDFMIRFDKINHDWIDVCTKLNIKVELPHLYNTTHKSYHDYYNNESIDIINQLYHRDIETFQFSY